MSAVIPNKLVLHEEMDPLGSQVQRIKYESKAGTAQAAGISTIYVPSTRNGYMKCRNSWLNFSVKCKVNGTQHKPPVYQLSMSHQLVMDI